MKRISRIETEWSLDQTQDVRILESRGPKKLTHSHVQEILETRKKMLLSLKGDVVVSLLDVLDGKIKYENASLLGFLEADTKANDAQKKSGGILRSEYFIQKSLDINLL